ncbi:MAG TPA: tetratricopeptide repeat protein [Verrucomicrobiae bacterium]|nr:tetratricopeptide repeat protein [Verrucomicrobiae bacterium]
MISACAHGDLHLQIVEVTKEIEKAPRNAELYMRRAELHRAHYDWDLAQADFDYALALDPKLPFIDLARARMFLEANWPLSCKTAVDKFLVKNPDHWEGRMIRARALAKLNRGIEAAEDFTKSIAKSPDGRPELFLERAQALASAGKDHIDEAIRGLDEGIQSMGALVTLELYAMDLETENGRFDAGLKRLDAIMAKAPRKETWLERRGNILRQAGKPEDARKAYQAALDAMKTLPPARRNVPAMVDLEKRLRSNIESLSSAASK